MTWRASRRVARLFAGGTDGNERLTATTAAVLLVLLALEGATILSLRTMLSVHVFVGMLLIPPVALKLASTGWRFACYYRGRAEYVAKGPPARLARVVVAPLVVASTVALFATGVALLVVGPDGGFVLGLHKVSFVVWFVALSVHVLSYVRRLPSLVREPSRGTSLRRAVVLATLGVGLVVAALTEPLAHPWLHRGRDGQARERVRFTKTLSSAARRPTATAPVRTAASPRLETSTLGG